MTCWTSKRYRGRRKHICIPTLGWAFFYWRCPPPPQEKEEKWLNHYPDIEPRENICAFQRQGCVESCDSIKDMDPVSMTRLERKIVESETYENIDEFRRAGWHMWCSFEEDISLRKHLDCRCWCIGHERTSLTRCWCDRVLPYPCKHCSLKREPSCVSPSTFP